MSTTVNTTKPNTMDLVERLSCDNVTAATEDSSHPLVEVMEAKWESIYWELVWKSPRLARKLRDLRRQTREVCSESSDGGDS